ncbi:hypothetical protein NPIL_384251, partial [Nephila pilipes]
TLCDDAGRKCMPGLECKERMTRYGTSRARTCQDPSDENMTSRGTMIPTTPTDMPTDMSSMSTDMPTDTSSMSTDMPTMSTNDNSE